MIQYQTLVTTDIKRVIREDLLNCGVDKNTFETVNNVKKAILEKLSNTKASEEELAASIKELIDDAFKTYTQTIMDF